MCMYVSERERELEGEEDQEGEGEGDRRCLCLHREVKECGEVGEEFLGEQFR